VLKQEIAIGRASDHDRSIADRQDLVSPLMIKAKAADDAVSTLQSRSPPSMLRALVGSSVDEAALIPIGAFGPALKRRDQRDRRGPPIGPTEPKSALRFVRGRLSNLSCDAEIGGKPGRADRVPGTQGCFVAVSMMGA
jgi:hypothetical protein